MHLLNIFDVIILTSNKKDNYYYSLVIIMNPIKMMVGHHSFPIIKTPRQTRSQAKPLEKMSSSSPITGKIEPSGTKFRSSQSWQKFYTSSSHSVFKPFSISKSNFLLLFLKNREQVYRFHPFVVMREISKVSR